MQSFGDFFVVGKCFWANSLMDDGKMNHQCISLCIVSRHQIKCGMPYQYSLPAENIGYLLYLRDSPRMSYFVIIRA